jgi:signal transduction histidine kinase
MIVSVRARLTVWFSGVFFCGALLLGLSAYLSVRAICVRVIDNELTSRIDGIRNFMSEHISRFPISRVQEELSVHTALKPVYLAVQDDAGNLVYCGSAFSGGCKARAATPATTFIIDEGMRILATTQVVGGQRYWIRAGSDLSFESAVMRHFFYWLLIVAPAALVSSALGGYWLSGRALKPIKGIIVEVRAIGEQSLDSRLHVPKTNDEIQTLSETLNGMLDRIERAFRQVTEITTNASHELRTPISVIRTSAEIALLNARPTVASHGDALRQICAEAEKTTYLLESILMLARAESGVQPLHFSHISLAASVGQSIRTCRHLAETKRIDLCFLEDSSDLSVRADAAHLNRLWLLLLDNAIKYTPAGGRVIVRIASSSEGDPVCEISDNGIGIDAKELSRIFERFYRAVNARYSPEAGSGLGLAIACRIAKAHDATIAVNSVYGVGSVFRIQFKSPALSTSRTGLRGEGSAASISPVEDRLVLSERIDDELDRARFHSPR